MSTLASELVSVIRFVSGVQYYVENRELGYGVIASVVYAYVNLLLTPYFVLNVILTVLFVPDSEIKAHVAQQEANEQYTKSITRSKGYGWRG